MNFTVTLMWLSSSDLWIFISFFEVLKQPSIERRVICLMGLQSKKLMF